MAKEIHNLEKVLFFKKNVYQTVEFINILMLCISQTKLPPYPPRAKVGIW